MSVRLNLNPAKAVASPAPPTERPRTEPRPETPSRQTPLSPLSGGERPTPPPVGGRTTMPVVENVRVALMGLGANKLRAALTMLGIIIGLRQ